MKLNEKTAIIKTDITKKKVHIGLIILGMIFLNANIFAQTEEWKTEKTKDGQITVSSNISKRADENGDEVQLLEYTATTTASVSMQNCISVIKDVSKHKEFTDDDISKKIKTISDNEWVVYYYTGAMWPFSDFDCVAKMILSEDETKRTATFTLTAVPSMLEEKKKVDRMTYYNVTYAFEDLGNGKVEITTTGKMSPTMEAPAWMMKKWFPEGPADILRIIIKLAKSS